METLGKFIRGIASIPLIGGALVFVLAFLPLLAVIPLNLSNGLSIIIGGLLMAAWCYFLKVKNIINIVTPFIPFPMWILGIVIAVVGIYGMLTNAWDDPNMDTEFEPQEVTRSKSVPTAPPKPEVILAPDAEPVDLSKVDKIQNENSVDDLSNIKDEAAESALLEMQQALADLEELSQAIGQEKLDELIGEQVGSENSLNFDEAMAEMRKQIAELKSQGYGTGSAE